MRRMLFTILLFPMTISIGLTAPTERDRWHDTGVQDLIFIGETRPILIRLRVDVGGKPLHQVWETFVRDTFEKADTNGDGLLGDAEIDHLPPPSILFGSFQKDFIRRTDSGLRDVDWVDWCSGNNSQYPFRFVASEVVRDSLLPRSGPKAPPIVVLGGNNQINRELFHFLDANDDKSLSRQELEACHRQLARRDENDDELIEINELIDTSLRGISDSDMTLAARLMWQYGRNTSTLGMRAKDLSLTEAAMAALDRDKDGYLNEAELNDFHHRAADITLRLSFDRRPGDKAIEVRDSAENIRVIWSADGSPTLNVGLLDLAVEMIEPSVNNGQAALKELYRLRFKRADGDRNGYLDAAEIRQTYFLSGLFEMMDFDHNGKVFEKEFDDAWKRWSRFPSGERVCVSLTAKPSGAELFEALDANSDRRLSVREMREAARLLEKWDRNGDSLLGLDEIPRKLIVTLRRGPDLISDDDSGSGSSYGRRFFSELPRGPIWFRKLDRNGDGDVSRREFVGTSTQFARIDTDKDGLLSADEAELFDRQNRR